MPSVTSAGFVQGNEARTGKGEGHDQQPVDWSKARVGYGGTRNVSNGEFVFSLNDLRHYMTI